MAYIFALIGAVAVGLCVAAEPAVNSGLGRIITPKLATLHSFIVGTALILIINIFSGGFKNYKMIIKAPPYLWIGGVLGITIVYFGARVTPVLGVATTVTVIVAAQLLGGIAIDTLGLFGVNKVPLDIKKVLGILMIIAAIILMEWNNFVLKK